jgi:phosphatidylserine synthase
MPTRLVPIPFTPVEARRRIAHGYLVKPDRLARMAIRFVPTALVLVRLVLGPQVIWNAITIRSKTLSVAAMVTALISDVFDGIIARRLGVDTPTLRRADSIVDVIFYCCAGTALRIVRPDVATTWWPVAAGFVTAEAVVQAIHLHRFGRTTAVHAWSSKVWGLVLFAGSTAVFLGEGDALPLCVMTLVGVVAYTDLLLIVSLSRAIPVDVRGIGSALRRRHE